MVIAALILWPIAIVLGALAWRRGGKAGMTDAGSFCLQAGRQIAPRLVLAILAASFLAELVPSHMVGRILGANTGIGGIFLASVLGGLLPGGPMISFPIALLLWQSGAGIPQMVALLTGWSVFAIHRVIAYEVPLMGWRFAAIRLMSVAVMPPLAGVATALVLAGLELVFGDVAISIGSPPLFH